MRTFAALLLLVVNLSTGAFAQTLNGVKLGAVPSTLDVLSLPSIAREGHAHLKTTKFTLRNGNLLSVTYDSKANKILFIENDWNLKDEASSSGLNSLTFGVTTLEDIRLRNGSNGFSWKNVAMQRQGDEVISFNAYEIRSRPSSIVVFVTVIRVSEYESAPLEKRDFAKLSRLHSIILASEDYLDAIWGSEKSYDGSSKPIAWTK